ncbi:MAG: HD domain-containing protein [Clostridiaceae bacterium]|jgi:poly(A) polymerase|nr:HD domain-containing protein [Clostridiaceae bacterium]
MNSQIVSKIKNDKILSEISKLATGEVYVVGGTVRDWFLGKDTFDRDIIVINDSAKEFALKVKETLGGTFVPLDEVNNIYRVVLPDKMNYIDITNAVENSLERDILRRDLTINSIAVNLKTCEVVDITGGITDIKNGVLHCISEENFIDDPLRLLRVFRFQALFGFEIERDTFNYICEHSKLISKPAKERVNYELLKMFSGDFCVKALKHMNKSWMLEEIFPFVKELKQVPPNSHHHLDLFHHSLEVVNQIQNIYEKSDKYVQTHLDTVEFGGFSRLTYLKLAGFMHDIGKFSTWTIEPETGRHRFIKHDDVGAKMSISILKKLKFSKKQIEYISKMIKYHIYPSSVMQSPEITDKIMMRYVRKMNTDVIDNIVIAKADRLSARGPVITDEIVEKNISSLNKLLNFYNDNKDLLKPLPVLIDGNEIMSILNINPSKMLGKILDELHEKQLNGEILDKEHAILFVKNYNFEENK